jgi:hypothetical protein
VNAQSPIIAAAGNALSARAMLARLKISKWSAVKLDKKITHDVAEQHQAADGAGRYNKRLLGKGALAKIDTVANAARSEHASRTLPWSDEGARILSTRGFVDYSNKLRELKADFESAVAEFAANYSAYVDAARAELNGMFREADYPHIGDIAGRFSFSFEFSNMPDSRDFRVELDAAQAADIRASMDASAREAFAAATRDVWQRVAEAVGHMAEKLRAYKPATAKGETTAGVFRDSLVDNVRELVALLPSLNIADDPALTAIADRIARDLCADDAKALRDNAGARESVAAAAESILQDVSAYLA